MDLGFSSLRLNWRAASNGVLPLKPIAVSSTVFGITWPNRPLRTCKCGKCECQLGYLQEQDREEEKVHEFLSGLDENYRTVRSTLVSRSRIQPLEEVYHVLCQEEDLNTSSRTVDETTDVSAYAVQTRSRVHQSRSDEHDRSTLCKHCNRSGHASDSCFAVVGYPEWWGDIPRTRTVQGRGGRGGGFSSVNPGRGRGVSYANALQVPQLPPATHANYVLTDRDRDGVHGLNDAQWCALMNLLNIDNTNSTATEKLLGMFSPPPWIMDTGA